MREEYVLVARINEETPTLPSINSIDLPMDVSFKNSQINMTEME